MNKLAYAMILAAGRGERMRPLTDTTPKPLLTVNDKPLLDYHLANIAAAGIHNIAINNAHLGEQIIEYVDANTPDAVIVNHFTETTALETAGGVANALPALGGECFLLVNGDVFCDLDFSRLQMLADRVTEKMPALIVGVPNPEHHPDGDFSMISASKPCDDHKPALTEALLFMGAKSTFTFSGISILHCSLFENISVEKAALGPLLKQLAEELRLQAVLYHGVWCDVGTPERLAWINEKSGNRS